MAEDRSTGEQVHADLLGVAQDIGLAISRLSTEERLARADGHPDQYALDLIADAAAVPTLLRAGYSVHSEESGLHQAGRPITVVLDPIDGSSNCSRDFPAYGPSICAVDTMGPLAAVVSNLATDRTYSALRGAGAWLNGVKIEVSSHRELDRAWLHVDLYDSELNESSWVRNLGASAHGMSLVADGTLDGYVDVVSRQAPWDYLGASLLIECAGGVVSSIGPRVAYEAGDAALRRIVAAGTVELSELLQSLTGA
jgi:myo-inositol-1(or 4)-monophosphatase